MAKVLQEFVRLLSARIARLNKTGHLGGALLSCAAIASLSGSSAHAATNPQLQSRHMPQTETVLYTFTGVGSDGALPQGGVIRDSSGNLYGTTYYGGNGGAGTVYEIDQSGAETILYQFSGGSDGGFPDGGLAMDSAGNLYGTAQIGGDASCTYFGFTGCGVVFELSPAGNGTWTETVLHAFSGQSDGLHPYGESLVLDSSGNLYGTTGRGGNLNCKEGVGYGCGVVFELSPNGEGEWDCTVLHTFEGHPKDGMSPEGVVMDAQGDVFGVTAYGGAKKKGTIFTVSASGHEEVLHSFTGRADGDYPGPAPLLIDADGNLYGTANGGGAHAWGTVYELTQSGTYSVLYNFCSRKVHRVCTDGGAPTTGVVMDASGDIYGSTSGGGTDGYGTIFELTSSGETVLHDFTRGADGGDPTGGSLVLDSSGNLYGSADAGGDSCSEASYGCGVVFELTP